MSGENQEGFLCVEWRARGVPSVPGALVLYIGGGYMDVSEVVVFMILQNVRPETSILGPSGGESVSPCEVMLQIAGMTMDSCV